ncbi:MAG: hypothetical protein GC136_00150 [Alphaproteobacteria bacterium]|nr:hypothetical protein [Alphaproteobacteria bacterium]
MKTIPAPPRKPLNLGASVGQRMENREDDVRNVKSSLNTLGYNAGNRNSGFTTQIMEDAIRNFQSDNFLRNDGYMNPQGETMKALNSKLDSLPGLSRTILKSIDDSQLLKSTRDFEKFVSHPYKDSKGNITIGYGALVPNEESFMDLPLKIQQNIRMDSVRAASTEEKQQAFRTLERYQTDFQERSASHYKPDRWKNNFSPIFTTADDAEEILFERAREHARDLERKMPNLYSHPLPAQEALFDMEYNMGRRFNAAKWGGLYSGLELRDYEKAARESHRNSGDIRRNKWTEDKFREATKWRD